MLYRIDTPSGPVTDLIGPRLFRSYRIARRIAGEVAHERGHDATVTRIGRAGHLSHAVTIRPIR